MFGGWRPGGARRGKERRVGRSRWFVSAGGGGVDCLADWWVMGDGGWKMRVEVAGKIREGRE